MMEFGTVMEELEILGTDYTKKRYISNGAHEPLYGTATGKMKPMSKEIGIDQELAEELYATGMTEADYDRWLEAAYFFMLSDYVVAVTLSESDIAQKVSDKWIASGEDLKMSAGWSCYCWLLGRREDKEFSEEKIANMLDLTKKLSMTFRHKQKMR